MQKEVISDLRHESSFFQKREGSLHVIDLSREICKPVLNLDFTGIRPPPPPQVSLSLGLSSIFLAVRGFAYISQQGGERRIN